MFPSLPNNQFPKVVGIVGYGFVAAHGLSVWKNRLIQRWSRRAVEFRLRAHSLIAARANGRSQGAAQGAAQGGVPGAAQGAAQKAAQKAAELEASRAHREVVVNEVAYLHIGLPVWW